MNASLRILAWLLAVALVALPVVAVLNGWVGAERWPLGRLRVTGDFKRISPEQLRAVVLPYAKSGFFAVKLQNAQDAIERLPWVESAQVRKSWPDVLEVRVVEHQPFARWGANQMLSEQGRLFPVPPLLKDLQLPQLDGPDSKTAEVVELYNESRALFAPAGLDVKQLALDARGSWSLGLSNGVKIVVGRDDARTRLQRFARVLPQLTDPQQPIQRADLRYTNGFTVERGVGNGESGMGKTPPSQPAHGLTLARPSPLTDIPLLTIPHSPFSIPGFTT
jgi:cell division protein FtsQ